MFRRRQRDEGPLDGVDPSALPTRWAAPVADALATRGRWVDLVAGLRPGPVRDRLGELSATLDEGVLAVWETAVRAVEVGRIIETLDAASVTDEYKQAKRDPSAPPELVDALQARFTSVQRVMNAVDDADERLRLLDARLGAVVARGAEVALAAGAGSDALGAELTSVVDELGALRSSLESLA